MKLFTIISFFITDQANCQNTDILSINQMMIDKYSNGVVKDSSILRIELSTNNVDSIYLKVINLCSDTICLPRKIMLEYPKPVSYILFCIGDSTLLNIESSDGFSNNNVQFDYSFKYCNVDEFSGIVDFEQLKIISNNTNKYGMVFIPPFAAVNIPLNCYFKQKYMFIRFQTLVNKNGIVFKLQKESNSVYMP